MRTIDADALKRKYEVRKRLFCRNRIEFSILSDKDKARVDELDNCIADILNTPTIEPERKTGKWVNNINDMPICNQCGYMTPYDRAIDDYEYGNYCPNCGAKMEGESDE